MRRLVQHHRPRHLQRLERVAPRRAARRKKTGEEELAGRKARGGERRGGGAWAGYRTHARADTMCLGDEMRAGIGERGRARVAHESDVLSLAQELDQLRARGALVM